MTDLVKEARVRVDGLRKLAANVRETPGPPTILLSGEQIDGEPVAGKRLTGPAADALIASAKIHGDSADFIARLAARLEALEAAQQWRPIADAPRDGMQEAARTARGES